MHTIQLKIDDTIFDKVMTMLASLPQDKVKVEENIYYCPAITIEEAKKKVNQAINNIENNKGLQLNEAFDKVLKS